MKIPLPFLRKTTNSNSITYDKDTLNTTLLEWSTITKDLVVAITYTYSNVFVSTTDGIICRFCGPGIPNWKIENAREHTSDCPMTLVGDALTKAKHLEIIADKLIPYATKTKNKP